MRSHIHHNHEDGRKHEKCQFCNRNFKTSKARETHEKLHEGGTNRNIKWCDICQTAWPSTQNLNNHIKTIHKKQRDYKCNICDKGKSFSISRIFFCEFSISRIFFVIFQFHEFFSLSIWPSNIFKNAH